MLFKFKLKKNDEPYPALDQEYDLLWRQLRILTLSMTIVGALCIVLMFSFLWILPLKEVVPMIVVSNSKGEQIYHVQPLEKTTKGYDLLVENIARNYVMDAESYDGQSEAFRIHRLEAFSSPGVAEHLQKIHPDHAHSFFKEFKERGISRSVHIKSSTSLAPSLPNVWQVEWEAVDLDTKTHTEHNSTWISTLTVEFKEKEFKVEDRFLNPMGFTVMHYDVSSRK